MLAAHAAPPRAQAYVVVKCLEDAQRACARDKDIFHPKFGERYVRVSIAEDMSPADLLALISSGAAAATSKARLPRSSHSCQARSLLAVASLHAPRQLKPPPGPADSSPLRGPPGGDMHPASRPATARPGLPAEDNGFGGQGTRLGVGKRERCTSVGVH